MDGRTCNIKQKCVKIQTPRQAKRGRDTKIPQSGAPPEKVSDEAVHKDLGDRMERAATTASSLEAEQDSGSGPRERQIQALIDKKKVIITKTSTRSDLKLDDAEGTYCLPTATIFSELERIGAKTTSWNEFSSTMASTIICLATNKNFNFSKYIFDNMVKKLEGGVKFLMYPRFVQVFLDKQVEGMSNHKGIYVIPSHNKKVFANMKRPRKGFSGKVTPLFATMMVQDTKDMGKDSAAPTDSHSTPIHTQPTSSKSQKKKSRRVLALEITKSNQALEIESLTRRVKSLEKRRKSRTPGFKRLRKGRKITDLDADAEVTLVDETQEMNDDNLMFDKEMKRVNTFVDMNTELVKSSETRTEGSSKRARDELESDNSKKQKIDEHVEAEKDDDQEEAEMKKHIEIVKDDEVAIDAIPLAIKPLVIVKYKIVKEGKFVYFQLIRADGSSKRYLSMIKMLQNIDREDLETL
ncbi:hypothetical protein Tco_0726256 [Tanacetum coccineum]|uniref:Uncharacterized protein n=1 Tax=Tanacetum coccineum TaxID=301880 RepID=A0ABQ4YHE0_9ASTR